MGRFPYSFRSRTSKDDPALDRALALNFAKAATEDYVDAAVVTASANPDASTTTKGVSKLSVAPATATDPIAVGTNDPRMSDARTPTAHAHPIDEVTNLQASLDAKAPLASPALTGTPTAPTAAVGTSTTQVATTAFVHAVMPVGVVMAYTVSTGGSLPAAWLACAGQALSRTTYAALFAVMGTTFGAGDGSTTFNLPDLRGRAIAGVDNMGGTDAGRLSWPNDIGTAGGTETHLLTAAESGIRGHGHAYQYRDVVVGTAAGTNVSQPRADAANTATRAEGASTNPIVNHPGADAVNAHQNMQPTMLLTWIVYTGVA